MEWCSRPPLHLRRRRRTRMVGDCYKSTRRKMLRSILYEDDTLNQTNMFSTGYFALLLVLLATSACAKIYERCELARELKEKYNVPEDQLATWVCIARHESNFDTTAVGTLAQGKDNGIFQISDLFWCEYVSTDIYFYFDLLISSY